MVLTVDTALFHSSEESKIGPDVNEFLRSHKLRASLGLTAAFPIFFSKDGSVVWPVSLYIYECGVVSPSSSVKTIQTYKENLISWLGYLERCRIALEDANEEDLLRYRNEMHALVSDRTQKRLQPSTINQRTASVARFYSWANAKGHFPSRLGDFISTYGGRRSGELARKTDNQSVVGYRLKIRTVTPFPSIVRIDEFCELLTHSKSEGEALAYRLMLASGLRRGEICRLNIGDIPDVSAQDPALSPLIEIEIIRKGAKRDKVKVPFALIEELNWFVLMERCVSPGARPRNFRAEPLFVNKRKRRFKPDHFGSNFKAAANSAGVRCTCHSLRHTFAICVLKILQDSARRGAEINPLKVLQRLMGHAHIETTEIYLRALDAYSDEVIKALDYLYGAALPRSLSKVDQW
jgi:site-specific recombinase XerD